MYWMHPCAKKILSCPLWKRDRTKETNLCEWITKSFSLNAHLPMKKPASAASGTNMLLDTQLHAYGIEWHLLPTPKCMHVWRNGTRHIACGNWKYILRIFPTLIVSRQVVLWEKYGRTLDDGPALHLVSVFCCCIAGSLIRIFHWHSVSMTRPLDHGYRNLRWKMIASSVLSIVMRPIGKLTMSWNGARGIVICEQAHSSFRSFDESMWGTRGFHFFLLTDVKLRTENALPTWFRQIVHFLHVYFYSAHRKCLYSFLWNPMSE